MTPTYFHFDSAQHDLVPPKDGILSRTLFQDDRMRVMGFAFDTGQELSEHTASVPAMISFVSGEVKVKLGEDSWVRPKPGEWIYMQANLPHSVFAETPTVMLLAMVQKQKD